MEKLAVEHKENGYESIAASEAKVLLKKPAQSKSSLGVKIGAAAAVVILAIGGYLYSTSGQVSTDDAFIEGHIVAVSPQVEGHIARVLIDDNQQVEQGQLLAEIRPEDFETKRDHAKATVDGATARLRHARADLSRYQALVANDEATRQTLDNAEAAADSAQADLAAAQAELKQAELNLSYTKITAPVAGRITRKSVEQDAYVAPEQPLLTIVPSNVWVIANFKETQLRKMKPGQRAEIKVDATGQKLLGRVDSIQSGTGARFSLLPAENATGNYVKVVQRVPVKIVLDNTQQASLLAPGMSVEASVELK